MVRRCAVWNEDNKRGKTAFFWQHRDVCQNNYLWKGECRLKKRIPGMTIRLLVVLTMVAALVGVIAAPASAQTAEALAVTFDEDWYSAGDTATVTFGGGGKNAASYEKEWIHVAVLTETGLDMKSAWIEETGPDTDTWKYSLDLVDETSGAGEIEVAEVDNIVALYDDAPGAVATTLNGALIIGAVTVTVTDATGLIVGDWVRIGALAHPDAEYREVTAIVGNDLTVAALDKAHADAQDVQEAAVGTAGADDAAPTTTLDNETAFLNATDIPENTYNINVATATDAAGAGVKTVVVSISGVDNVIYYNPIGTATVNNVPYIWSVPGDGKYTIVARSTDVLGNAEAVPDLTGYATDALAEAGEPNVEIVTVDTVVPAISAPAAVNEAVAAAGDVVAVGGQVTLSVTVTDATSGVIAGAVTADLTSIGGGAAVALTEDAETAGLWELEDVGSGAALGALGTAGAKVIPVDATDQAGNDAVTVDVEFTVQADTVDPTVSAVELDYLKGTQAKVGDTVTIDVTTADDISGVATVMMDQDEAEDVFGLGVALDITAGPALAVAAGTAVGVYPITCTVTDNAGNTSTTTVEIEVVTDYTTYKFDLAKGKNMISVPVALTTPKIWEALASIAGSVTKVYAYNGGIPMTSAPIETSEGSGLYIWKGDLTELKPGMGYIIDMAVADELVIGIEVADIASPPPAVSLGAGWSIIGFSSLTLEPNMPVQDYLSSLAYSWTVVYDEDWNQARPDGQGGSNAIGAFAAVGADAILESDTAYWIYLSSAGSLVP